MADTLLQSVIMALHEFWGKQGCLLWQPYNVQVGAGTNNPGTLLRVLGPEPWRVAYVEPSVRPDDGRYGENPNRMQLYYQYQVVLKPDPGNPQELYLQSLEAIGIDLRHHDVRFVEDNWKSPPLGAWGLGWEVWLDGQEITQFTYFQQAGGLKLDPVSVEITYGIERIVLALQGKNSAWDIQWTDDITYRDIFMQSEIEHCKYYFDVADVKALKHVYDTYERESGRALEADLVVPAYDYVLKCSHLFNVLDTRGAIGVTERAYYFRRMAGMTRNVAKAYLDQRTKLKFPLLKNGRVWPAASKQRRAKLTPAPTENADVLLEIGVEELPSEDLQVAIAQLTEAAPKLFADLRLSSNGVNVYGTPRRLIVYAIDVAPRQADEERVIKGPPANKAFDDKGKPTPVAEGFAHKQGIPVSKLKVEDVEGGQYVMARVKAVGKPTIDVLAEALPGLVSSIKFTETMRWNKSEVYFSRPIRWYVALIGDAVIPFEYAGVPSGRITRGTRAGGSRPISIKDATDYEHAMHTRGIITDRLLRQEIVWENLEKLAAQVGGVVRSDPELLEEVGNLVEQPTVLRGKFDSRFLELPRDVLITVMRKKQRYFPIEDATGKLMPYFLAVRNGDDKHLKEVIKGNEHVLTARFSDAEFFFRDDRQHALADRVDRLKTMTFQEKLGSIYDKNQRLISYVEPLGRLLGVARGDLQTARDAAAIAKADQATRMVVEMTSLEGIMGREYALREGHPMPVADAILEHYRPRENVSPSGMLLALADRLDSLVGLFAVGLAPTASADPFALRRAALRVVQLLLEREIDVDLREAIKLIAGGQPVPVSEQVQADVLAFIAGRLRVYFLEEAKLAPVDVVDAVLAEQAFNPYRAQVGVTELARWVQRPDWSPILDSYARCVRITRDKPPYKLDSIMLTPGESHVLYTAARRIYDQLEPEDNVGMLLTLFEPIVPIITTFFDHVLVMDDNQAVRENRLALLQYVAALARGRADLSRLSGF